MKITTYTALSIVLFLTLSQRMVMGASYEPHGLNANDLRTRLDQYVESLRYLDSECDVLNVIRLSSGRISERKFKVNCLVRDYVKRISQYSEGNVEDDKAWFDIRETLLFPSGATAEWRHPGFPGQLSFGQTSNDCNRIRHSAEEIGDPFFVLKKIARVMKRDTFRVVESRPESIIARVSMPGEAQDVPASDETAETDYIEIVFSRKYDCLPVSMKRICLRSDPDRVFDSGSAFEIEYSHTDQNTFVPQVIRQDTRLKDDVEGVLATTWTYKTFDLTARPVMNEMTLILPVGVLAENVDSRRRFTVTSKDDDAAVTLKKQFGDFIEIQSAKAAMQAVARSFVGLCPDLPDQYQLLRQQHAPAFATSDTSRWNVCLLAAHGFGLWVIAGYWRKRCRAATD